MPSVRVFGGGASGRRLLGYECGALVIRINTLMMQKRGSWNCFRHFHHETTQQKDGFLGNKPVPYMKSASADAVGNKLPLFTWAT